MLRRYRPIKIWNFSLKSISLYLQFSSAFQIHYYIYGTDQNICCNKGSQNNYLLVMSIKNMRRFEAAHIGIHAKLLKTLIS